MFNYENYDKLRRLQGRTNTYICQKLGMTSSYMADVRNGKNTVSDERINKIAEILGTTYEYLTGQTDEMYLPQNDINEVVEAYKNNPRLRILFDASKNLNKNDLERLATFAEMLNESRKD